MPRSSARRASSSNEMSFGAIRPSLGRDSQPGPPTASTRQARVLRMVALRASEWQAPSAAGAHDQAREEPDQPGEAHREVDRCRRGRSGYASPHVRLSIARLGPPLHGHAPGLPLLVRRAPDHLALVSNRGGGWQAWAHDLADGYVAQGERRRAWAVEEVWIAPDGRLVWLRDDRGTRPASGWPKPSRAAPSRPSCPACLRAGRPACPSPGSGSPPASRWTASIGSTSPRPAATLAACTGPSARAAWVPSGPREPAGSRRTGGCCASVTPSTATSCGPPSGSWTPAPARPSPTWTTRLVAWTRARGRPTAAVLRSRTSGGTAPARRSGARTARGGTSNVDLPGDVTPVDWFPAGDALLVLHSFEGRGELHRLDPSNGSLGRLAAPGGDLTRARVRPDGEVWFHASDATTPPRVLDLRGREPVVSPDPPPPPGRRVPVTVGHEPPRRPDPELRRDPGWRRTVPARALRARRSRVARARRLRPRDPSVRRRRLRRRPPQLPGLHGLRGRRSARRWSATSAGPRPRTSWPCSILWSPKAWPTRARLSGADGPGAVAWRASTPASTPIGSARSSRASPPGDFVAAHWASAPELQAWDDAVYGGSPTEVPDAYARSDPMTYVEAVRPPRS